MPLHRSRRPRNRSRALADRLPGTSPTGLRVGGRWRSSAEILRIGKTDAYPMDPSLPCKTEGSRNGDAVATEEHDRASGSQRRVFAGAQRNTRQRARRSAPRRRNRVLLRVRSTKLCESCPTDAGRVRAVRAGSDRFLVSLVTSYRTSNLCSRSLRRTGSWKSLDSAATSPMRSTLARHPTLARDSGPHRPSRRVLPRELRR